MVFAQNCANLTFLSCEPFNIAFLAKIAIFEPIGSKQGYLSHLLKPYGTLFSTFSTHTQPQYEFKMRKTGLFFSSKGGMGRHCALWAILGGQGGGYYQGSRILLFLVSNERYGPYELFTCLFFLVYSMWCMLCMQNMHKTPKMAYFS